MSLILDALNKNERERQAPREVPDLAAGPHYTAPPAASHAKALLIGVVVLAVLVLALLIALLMRPAGQAPAVVPAPTPAAALEPQAPPLVTAQSPREPVQQWRPLPRPAAEQASRPAAVELAGPAATPPAPEDIAALYAAEANAPASGAPVEREQMATLWREMQTQPLPERKAPAAAPVASKPATSKPPSTGTATKGRDPKGLAQFGGVPYLHELPQQQQAKIPTLMYNKHEAADGAVILNKKRFHLGQSPAQGVTIEQIVSDGIVLSFEGRQFKLDALSSWVNR